LLTTKGSVQKLVGSRGDVDSYIWSANTANENP
jgi:hypothetical protein